MSAHLIPVSARSLSLSWRSSPTLTSTVRVGDVDACVPYNDNEAWTSAMGYAVASPWHPWMVRICERCCVSRARCAVFVVR
jgi:hypothetical protein